MADQDPFVTALKALCDREGGYKAVAARANLSAANLSQIINGITLPSGNPRGVGPAVRKALNEVFPDWLSTAIAPPPANLAVLGHAPTVTQTKNAPSRVVSESQWALLEDFEILPEPERQTLRSRLAERARAARQAADDLYFKPNNIPAPVSNARVEESLLAGGMAPLPGGVAGYKKITEIPKEEPSESDLTKKEK